MVVELLDVPEYSGVFTIGPDGTIYLPRLRSLVVEGLTVVELRKFLTQQFSAYVREPQVFVSPAAYRPVRVYVGGEVARPGYYYLSGSQGIEGIEEAGTGATRFTDRENIQKITSNPATQVGPRILGVQVNGTSAMPTVFDALRTAGGVTPSQSSARCPSPENSP